mmetsp:Transcript_52475/g.131996  ORF Transcript_52475/g.131996 Transcript_52475/m.131996 type:complete len:361 (+) Transcript_52475:591-1673(+)
MRCRCSSLRRPVAPGDCPWAAVTMASELPARRGEARPPRRGDAAASRMGRCRVSMIAPAPAPAPEPAPAPAASPPCSCSPCARRCALMGAWSTLRLAIAASTPFGRRGDCPSSTTMEPLSAAPSSKNGFRLTYAEELLAERGTSEGRPGAGECGRGGGPCTGEPGALGGLEGDRVCIAVPGVFSGRWPGLRGWPTPLNACCGGSLRAAPGDARASSRGAVASPLGWLSFSTTVLSSSCVMDAISSSAVGDRTISTVGGAADAGGAVNCVSSCCSSWLDASGTPRLSFSAVRMRKHSSAPSPRFPRLEIGPFRGFVGVSAGGATDASGAPAVSPPGALLSFSLSSSSLSLFRSASFSNSAR